MMSITGVRLNLGSSDQILDGYINVDLVKPCDQIADLTKPWPWPDSSVDEIRAHDIFEHLPSKRFTMNEAWRTLKHGGILDLKVPTTAGRGAFQDDTHVSFWTPNDLSYFCKEGGLIHDYETQEAVWFNGAERIRFESSGYGPCDFHVIVARHRLYPRRVWYLEAQLQAIK